jgi:5-methylcytosine-specific restriction protein A
MPGRATNPNWTRDELILALDLYFRVNPRRVTDDDPEILALSRLLNQLPTHAERSDSEDFRNANGVRMKLSNFLRFDPSYAGVGLSRGSHLEKEVWDEFANDSAKLESTARAIASAGAELALLPKLLLAEEPEVEEAIEGQLLTRLHRFRERDAKLVRRKKQQALAIGCLKCEVCDFDFWAFYGALGEGFIECHHTLALSSLLSERKTRLDDLALVCANCHRMLHRSRPWPAITYLRELVISQRSGKPTQTPANLL